MTTSTETELNQLITEIDDLHRRRVNTVKRSLKYARDCGLLLMETRKFIDHGDWLDWCDENLSFSYRTAQVYVQVAKKWSQLKANAQRDAHFGLREALELLATKRPTKAESRRDPVDNLEADDGPAEFSQNEETSGSEPINDDPTVYRLNKAAGCGQVEKAHLPTEVQRFLDELQGIVQKLLDLTTCKISISKGATKTVEGLITQGRKAFDRLEKQCK